MKSASAADPIENQARPVRIGVSACLLGERVRFDGGHKRNDFLADTLGRFVQWVAVCPEVEFGLGTPRRSLRLVADGDHTRMIEAPKHGAEQFSGADHTDAMRNWAKRRALSLEHEELCGYILKKDSPSCGMERVKVYNSKGIASRSGRGLFAEALMRAYPALPVEEEGRLANPHLRENFIERVFAYHSVRRLFARPWKIADLIAFHTRRKLQLMSHNIKAYQELGRLAADAKTLTLGELRERYTIQFMAALRWPATPARHTNVLQHMAGYFTRRLDQTSRRELTSVIADYRAGLVPLIVPITLVRHHVLAFDIAYLKEQTYLQPHPKELMLRNHV